MDKARISMTQLHRNTGVPIPTIQRLRNDPAANPTISSLKPIADFFSLTVNQLIGDEPLPTNYVAGSYKDNQLNWIELPIISWEEVIKWPQVNIEKRNVKTLAIDIDISKTGYCLEVIEENLTNLAPGTILIVDPKAECKHRDFIIVQHKNEKKATLKQLLIEDEIKYIKSLVFGYQINKISNNYKLLGVVLEYRMEFHR
jgi:SOS-response transcriptional repressor LexA